MTDAPRAFQFFFCRNYPLYFSFADLLLRDSTSCENVVSEAMFMLWDMHADLTDEEECRSFLYTTIRRNCLNYLNFLRKNPSAGPYLAGERSGVPLPDDVLHELSLFIKQFDVNRHTGRPE